MLARIATDPRYPPLFAAAFPGQAAPIVWTNVIKAIATFQRGIVSSESTYDRYLRGQATLTEAELRGLTLFMGERAECFHCHGSFNFNDQVRHEGQSSIDTPFHNTGLYNIGGTVGMVTTAIALAAIAAMALVIDRRSFLTASIAYVALIISWIIRGSGEGSLGQWALILIVLGGFVTALGTWWVPLRNSLMRTLPDFPGKRRLPPYAG